MSLWWTEHWCSTHGSCLQTESSSDHQPLCCRVLCAHFLSRLLSPHHYLSFWPFTCNSFSVLSIQSLIDLVKQVERCRITLLDGEDQSESHEGFLSSAQLLHVSHFRLVSAERNLQKGKSRLRGGKWQSVQRNYLFFLRWCFNSQDLDGASQNYMSGKCWPRWQKKSYLDSHSSELLHDVSLSLLLGRTVIIVIALETRVLISKTLVSALPHVCSKGAVGFLQTFIFHFFKKRNSPLCLPASWRGFHIPQAPVSWKFPWSILTPEIMGEKMLSSVRWKSFKNK